MQDFDMENQLAQQRYQQALAEQNKPLSSPQGKMVGNIYVRSNPMEALISGLRMKQAKDELGASKQDLKDLQGKRQSAIADALRGFGEKSTGAPAVASSTTPAQMPSFDEADAATMQGVSGYGATTGAQAARAPDLRGAYADLMAAPDASLRQMGMKGMMEQQAKQAALAQQQQYMGILQKAQSPQQALQAGVPYEMVKNYTEAKNLGREKVEFKDVGGQFVPVTQYGETPTNVKPLGKTGNPFSDLILSKDGVMVPNAPLVGAKQSIAKAGATNVDARSFNTQESEQSKSYGKTLGEIRGTITQAGFDAPKQLAKLDRMDALLQGVDGGAAAPTLAQVSSLANSFGIKLDKNLGPKEAAIALAVNMASGMRQPGTGPMTDKDFDNFLKQVPDLSKSAEGRKQIMTTMRASIQRDLEAAKFARSYAQQNKGVIDDNFFDSMANFYAQNPVVNIPMPETNARGNQFRVVR